jgi:hypothetical protein
VKLRVKDVWKSIVEGDVAVADDDDDDENTSKQICIALRFAL